MLAPWARHPQIAGCETRLQTQSIWLHGLHCFLALDYTILRMRFLSKKQQWTLKSKHISTGYSDPRAAKEKGKCMELEGDWNKRGRTELRIWSPLPTSAAEHPCPGQRQAQSTPAARCRPSAGIWSRLVINNNDANGHQYSLSTS